ncbi:MAG TPA: signal peptidase I [Anaerolineae bacterium]|nr:signal peptidase I [Anaerolineae bacterium]
MNTLQTQTLNKSAVPTASPTRAPEEPASLKMLVGDLLETLLLAAVLFLIINTFTGRYQVLSVSMEPTLHEGQYLLISKASYWFHEPERGDILVVKPLNGDKNSIPLIKRLIGLPGDTVEARDGRIWINGVAINETYVSGPLAYADRWTLGPDEYFLLGDNRNNSSDSHSWGPLPRENIIGKAVFRYWPLELFGTFPQYAFAELEATP